MILEFNNISYFLYQYNLVPWNIKTKLKKVSSKNNCYKVNLLNGKNLFFIKQSLQGYTDNVEGLFKEVLFYSWINKNQFSFKLNMPHFLGFEKVNNVAIFDLILSKNIVNKNQLKYYQLNEILHLIFELQKLKWDNSFIIIIKNKPDLLKIIFETNEEFLISNDLLYLANILKNKKNFKDFFNTLTNVWDPNVICHNDIKWSNYLLEKRTNKIYWIDWERVCISDRYWDFANLIRLLSWRVLIIKTDYDFMFSNFKLFKEIRIIVLEIKVKFGIVDLNKLFILWIASILEKTFELLQEKSITICKGEEMIVLCENMIENKNVIEKKFV